MRLTLCIEGQLIEQTTTWFSTDEVVDLGLTMLFERQAIVDWFVARLNAEIDERIANRVALAIDGTDGNAESIGAYPRKLRDVVCNLAPANFLNAVEDALDLVGKVLEIRDDHPPCNACSIKRMFGRTAEQKAA